MAQTRRMAALTFHGHSSHNSGGGYAHITEPSAIRNVPTALSSTFDGLGLDCSVGYPWIVRPVCYIDLCAGLAMTSKSMLDRTQSRSTSAATPPQPSPASVSAASKTTQVSQRPHRMSPESPQPCGILARSQVQISHTENLETCRRHCPRRPYRCHR